jgi:hypothetical protein
VDMPHGLEVLSTRKHALAALGDRRLRSVATSGSLP